MNTKRITLIALTALALFAGCSDDFLVRPPEAQLTAANFYKTDEQVLAATAPLYSAVWKDYIDKANFKLGDIRGGTVYRAWNDRDHTLFNTTAVSVDSRDAYRSFYVIVGQANMAIYNINTFGGAGVTPEIKNHALAEARFMRATAYTHLVMNYGAVPIIENNVELLNNPQVPRHTIESVWEFIKRDYEFAAANLLEEPIADGRLTKWSAEGMLARTHLTLAGLGRSPGNRDQAHLDKAKEYAERVITMSGKTLATDYASLFRYPYDNNNESLFELQWVFTTAPNGYAYTNTMVSQITYSNDIANGDGWGGDISASWWMLSLYDGLMVDDGATPGFTLDQRLKATFMLPGFTYPEISQTIGRDAAGNEIYQGLVFPNPADDADNSFASIKKYVVGKARDVDNQSARQAYPNNTYMLRLAEMYLIYAEADLGNGTQLTSGKGYDYFNVIHQRAGNPEFEDPIGWDEIFEERVKEFAMESVVWYDLVRLHYYDEQKAYNIINAQDRGMFVVKPDRWPNPTGWTFTKTSWFTDRFAVASSGNFALPIPASEISQAPWLSGEPVPYAFPN